MKSSLRQTGTPQYRSRPRGNDRRLITQHPRRRFLSLAVGAVALPYEYFRNRARWSDYETASEGHGKLLPRQRPGI
jgi:hypothetical protein